LYLYLFWVFFFKKCVDNEKECLLACLFFKSCIWHIDPLTNPRHLGLSLSPPSDFSPPDNQLFHFLLDGMLPSFAWHQVPWASPFLVCFHPPLIAHSLSISTFNFDLFMLFVLPVGLSISLLPMSCQNIFRTFSDERLQFVCYSFGDFPKIHIQIGGLTPPCCLVVSCQRSSAWFWCCTSLIFLS